MTCPQTHGMLHRTLDLLTPDICLLCEATLRPRPHWLLCDWCLQALPHNTSSCPTCALPLTHAGACPACTAKAPLTRRTLAPLIHRDAARYLVHRLKYNRDLRAGRALACLMRVAINCAYAGDQRPALLIPVPTSWRRMLWRGFNQAGWLARDLGAYTAIATISTGISKSHRPPQASLSRVRRNSLPAATFTLAERTRRQIEGQHLAIVDDVLTTGATTLALAQALRQAGAGRIDIWCATRAVIDQPW